MSILKEVHSLPTFVALETLPVLTGQKRAASIKLTDTYIENRIAVLNRLDAGAFANQTEALRKSGGALDIEMKIDSFEASALQAAADELHESFCEMPEVSYLQANYLGDCIVVPEILQVEGDLKIGIRVYFFREDEAPPPAEIMRRNVAAIIDDAPRTFERYEGKLHGYPKCCITHFLDRSQNAPSPEMRSVAPLESVLREDQLGRPALSS